MKKVWKIAGIATLVAILGVATVGAVAFAQVAKEGVTSPFDFASKYREAIAGILGISVEKYDAAVEEAQKQVLDEAVTEGWLTQDQADQMQERMGQGFGAPGMGRGFPGPEMGFMGRDGNSLIGVTADKLGISVQDLMTELQGGKTIADVAKEKGVDTQTIIDAYLAQLGENLKQAVDDGKITQKQADLMLEQAKTRATDQLDSTLKGTGTWQGFGPRDGGWPGGMKGLPGMGDL
jgi:polyhydroxyalkanoate synthesis regulator phasin